LKPGLARSACGCDDFVGVGFLGRVWGRAVVGEVLADERGCAASGKPYRVFRYGADRGFANEDAKEFDAASAELTRRRDLEF
jgi:hypothetical protein